MNRINSKPQIVTAGTTVLYIATERGVVSRLSVVNVDGTNAIINLYKTDKDDTPNSISIIPKDTVIEPSSALFIDKSLVLIEGQSLVISTDKTLHIDINIQ